MGLPGRDVLCITTGLKIKRKRTAWSWPLLVYAGLVLVVVGTMMGLSYLLGERHHDPATDRPYESGIETTGSARIRLSARFYLVALFFIIFDLEAAFLFAWAITFQTVGWARSERVRRRLARHAGLPVARWRLD